MIVKMILADAVIGDEGALRPKPQPDPFRNAGKRGGERRPDGAVENPDRLRAMLAATAHQPNQVDAALQLRSGMLKINRRGHTRLRDEQILGRARRGAKNVTCPSGAAAAMARMNGKCQMTSPIPGLT